MTRWRMPGHAAQNTVRAVQTQRLRKEELSSGYKTDCEDALLILPGRKRIRSEPSALNQLNNEHDDGNHE